MLRSCLRAYTTSTKSSFTPFRVAVVGSGPAGFYTAHHLLRKDCHVTIDMYDALPVPHGLVRFGVAPDHPEVKNVMTTFDRVAEDARFQFLGNVPVGVREQRGLRVDDLKAHYDAIVFSYGASEDRRLGIPNEDAYGVESARAFVAWYNGLPGCENLSLPLEDTDTVVVVGQGNVALDVARVLLSPVDALRKTDITEYALETLLKSKVRHVHVVGRRGPLQASFTSKELREQMNLPGVAFHADHAWIADQVASASALLAKNRPMKRMMGILEKGSAMTSADRSWSLEFLRSPTEVLIHDDNYNNRVRGIRYEVNSLTDDGTRAIGTGVFEDAACGIVLRSIGYKSVPIEGLPSFDTRLGRVPNKYGKIVDDQGNEVPGMYTAGWLKRGPTGVIVSTMNDAYETADTILEDIASGQPMLTEGNIGKKQGAEGVMDILAAQGIRPVSYPDWKKIEQVEFDAGRKHGKPREKFTRVEDMLAVLGR